MKFKSEPAFLKTVEIAINCIRYEIDRLYPNFGCSGDLLRYLILVTYGGCYFDHDNEPGSKLLSQCSYSFATEAPQIGFISLTNEPGGGIKASIGNDGIICSPAHPVAKTLLILATENYRFDLADFVLLRDKQAAMSTYDNRRYRFNSTILRTGPVIARLALLKHFQDTINPDSQKPVSELYNSVFMQKAALEGAVSLDVITPKIVKGEFLLGSDVVQPRPNALSWNTPIRKCLVLEEAIQRAVEAMEFEEKHMGMTRELRFHARNVCYALIKPFSDVLRQPLIEHITRLVNNYYYKYELTYYSDKLIGLPLPVIINAKNIGKFLDRIGVPKELDQSINLPFELKNAEQLVMIMNPTSFHPDKAILCQQQECTDFFIEVGFSKDIAPKIAADFLSNHLLPLGTQEASTWEILMNHQGLLINSCLEDPVMTIQFLQIPAMGICATELMKTTQVLCTTCAFPKPTELVSVGKAIQCVNSKLFQTEIETSISTAKWEGRLTKSQQSMSYIMMQIHSYEVAKKIKNILFIALKKSSEKKTFPIMDILQLLATREKTPLGLIQGAIEILSVNQKSNEFNEAIMQLKELYQTTFRELSTKPVPKKPEPLKQESVQVQSSVRVIKPPNPQDIADDTQLHTLIRKTTDISMLITILSQEHFTVKDFECKNQQGFTPIELAEALEKNPVIIDELDKHYATLLVVSTLKF